MVQRPTITSFFYINISVVSFLFSCCYFLSWSKFGVLGLLINSNLTSLMLWPLFCFLSGELNSWGNLWFQLLQFCKAEFHTLQTKSKSRVQRICIFLCLFDQSSGSVLILLLQSYFKKCIIILLMGAADSFICVIYQTVTSMWRVFLWPKCAKIGIKIVEKVHLERILKEVTCIMGRSK